MPCGIKQNRSSRPLYLTIPAEDLERIVQDYMSGLSIIQCQKKWPQYVPSQIKSFLIRGGHTRSAKPAPSAPGAEEIRERASQVRKNWTHYIEKRRWVGRYAKKRTQVKGDFSHFHY